MSPKPILKRSVAEQAAQYNNTHAHPNRTHGVHFPPSTSLTCTFSAYSAAAYDRSPIVVSPNNCALPERGCPGRTYTLEESAAQKPHRGISYARDFHPRALVFASTRSSSPRSTRTPIDATMNDRPTFYPALPQLIPDLSSESDESDAFTSGPSASTSIPTFGIHGLAGPPSKFNSDPYTDVDMSRYTPCVDDSNALAFLPYPPSPPPSHKYQYAERIEPPPQNSRRRRGERETKHESSRDPDRIPNSGGSDTQHCVLAFSSLSISSSPTSLVTPKRRSTKKRSSISPHSYSPTSHSFSNLDDGCLGGF